MRNNIAEIEHSGHTQLNERIRFLYYYSISLLMI